MTILHIVSVEAARLPNGGFNVNSLHLNHGQLKQQPASKSEALALATQHIARDKSVDVGLMQINSANLPSLNLSLADALDPCTNIRAGAKILTDFYLRTDRKEPQQIRLLKALSAYNTGDYQKGFRNGYVVRYLRIAAKKK